MADKKTWAIIVGAAAGVAAASLAIAIYVQAHGEPELKTLQDKIQWAHDRLEELEQVANSLKKPLSAT